MRRCSLREHKKVHSLDQQGLFVWYARMISISSSYAEDADKPDCIREGCAVVCRAHLGPAYEVFCRACMYKLHKAIIVEFDDPVAIVNAAAGY